MDQSIFKSKSFEDAKDHVFFAPPLMVVYGLVGLWMWCGPGLMLVWWNAKVALLKVIHISSASCHIKAAILHLHINTTFRAFVQKHFGNLHTQIVESF